MSHPLFEIQGRTVLVTGSSRGIGHAMARALLEAGCKVVVHGSDPDRATAGRGRSLPRSPGMTRFSTSASTSRIPGR